MPDDSNDRQSGSLLRTNRTRVQVATGDVGAGTTVAEVVSSIDVDRDSALLEELRIGRLNALRSPTGVTPLGVPVFLVSSENQRAALYIPGPLRYRVLLERAALLERLQRIDELPAWAPNFDLVVGRTALSGWDPATAGSIATPGDPFRGELGRTQMRTLTVRDRSGRTFDARVYTSIDGNADSELLDRLLDQDLNVVVSPHDRTSAPVPLPLTVHLPDERRFVVMVPEHLAQRRLAELARTLRQLARSPVNVPHYVTTVCCVVGVHGLAQLLAAEEDDAGMRLPAAPAPKRQQGTFSAELAAPPSVEPDEGDDADDGPNLGLSPRERVGGPEFRPDRTNTALYLVANAPERFPGGEVDNSTLGTFGGPHPLLAFELSPNEAALWARHRIRLLAQFHNLDLYPLFALVLAAIDDDGNIIGQRFHCVDVANPDERSVLDSLASHFSLVVGLYGANGALTDAARFAGPLEQNVRTALALADKRHSKDAAEIDFDAAVARFRSPSFPRIGAMRHPFTRRSFTQLDSPAETMVACGIMAYWSQAPNHRYLLYNQSFGATWFDQIRTRVIDAALRFGVRLAPELRRTVADTERDATELCRRQLAAFAEVHLGLRNNDLDPVALWENWRILLEDAEEFGVDVDSEVVDLARAALTDARSYHATNGDLDDLA